MAIIRCKECSTSISSKANECPNCGHPAKKKTSLLTWAVTLLFGMFLISKCSGNDPTQPALSNSAPVAVKSVVDKTPKQKALDSVKLDFKWSRSAANIMIVKFTIINNSDRQIKDIEIKCTHYAKSGTRIDSNTRIIYDIVPANDHSIFEDFNMGFIHSQAEKTNCMVIDLKV